MCWTRYLAVDGGLASVVKYVGVDERAGLVLRRHMQASWRGSERPEKSACSKVSERVGVGPADGGRTRQRRRIGRTEAGPDRREPGQMPARACSARVITSMSTLLDHTTLHGTCSALSACSSFLRFA